MNRNPKKVALNRPVFAQRAFDSSALTVLTTLFHRFPETGDYNLLVRRREQVIHRTHVRIVAENAPHQVNVDLARLTDSDKDCDPDAKEGYTLVTGGVLGFYVSQGIGQYSVRVTQLGRREKRTLLNSSRAVPEGDLFAVTLVRPGTYQMVNAAGRGRGEIHVGLPKGEKYRTDRATLIEVDKKGIFNPRDVQILAGQTIVFQCAAPAHIRVELVKPAENTGAAIERQRYTWHKSQT